MVLRSGSLGGDLISDRRAFENYNFALVITLLRTCNNAASHLSTLPMVHVESGSGFRFGSQIYVKVLVDAESSTYYSSVNASGRGDSGATPTWATPFCAGVPN